MSSNDCNYSEELEVTKADIIQVIEKEKEDSFIAHFSTVLKRDFRSVGEIKTTEIRIWRQNVWNSFFYPVFIFELNKKNHLTNITDRMNPVGKLIYFLFILFISFVWLPWDFSFIRFDNYLIPFTFYILFLGIFFFVSIRIYRMEKQIQLEYLFEALNIEIKDTITKSEWSWHKILTRLILYPLCLFLLIVNILFVIPEGQILLSIGSLGIAGAYLFTDLKILFRKKEKIKDE